MTTIRCGIEVDADTLAEICKRFHVLELSLFGSVLREDFRDDSDVDVLVVFEPEARISLFDLSGLRIELGDLIGRDVDLGEKHTVKPLIRDQVHASARVIYARKAMKDHDIHIFYSEEDGGYIADIPDLRFCSAFGETPEEALAEVQIAEEALAVAGNRERNPDSPR